jgi:alpha-beta hydrolase superfamily lysophospholipase
MSQLEPERFQFTSADGLSIASVKWSGDHPVRGVVQIVHGLGEHIGRYAELAETSMHGEFVVYGNDHRGSRPQVAVNARLFDDFDLAAIPVKHLDGRNLW